MLGVKGKFVCFKSEIIYPSPFFPKRIICFTSVWFKKSSCLQMKATICFAICSSFRLKKFQHKRSPWKLPGTFSHKLKYFINDKSSFFSCLVFSISCMSSVLSCLILLLKWFWIFKNRGRHPLWLCWRQGFFPQIISPSDTIKIIFPHNIGEE